MSSKALLQQQTASIEHHAKSGWAIHRRKDIPVVFASQAFGDQGKVQVKAWRGSAAKPAFYYLFRDEARAATYCKEYAQGVASSQAFREKQAAERKAKRDALDASHHWMVGDVVYTSWGYDQTNVEYFQVVELKARSVVVRQIAENNSDHGQPGGGRTAPRRNEFVGPEILCPLDENGGFSAGPCYRGEKPSFRHRVSKWEGRAVYTSSTH